MLIECQVVFFFKQKTADEMRISDWSSDVCSSRLDLALHRQRLIDAHRRYACRGNGQVLLVKLRNEFRTEQSKDRERHQKECQAPGDERHRPAQRLVEQRQVTDRKSTRLNYSHSCATRMPSSACKKKIH